MQCSVCQLYTLEVSLEPHEDSDVTDTAVTPELLRRSRRVAGKVATDNIQYVQDFLEDEPSPDWLLVNGGRCKDLDLFFIHLFVYHYFIYYYDLITVV